LADRANYLNPKELYVRHADGSRICQSHGCEGDSVQSFCRFIGRGEQAQTGGDSGQRDAGAADDSAFKVMKAVPPGQTRANIIAAYTKQHQEGVNALTAAIERVKSTKTDGKAETASVPKPSLAELLLAVREE
jgi:hypothetical protein